MTLAMAPPDDETQEPVADMLSSVRAWLDGHLPELPPQWRQQGPTAWRHCAAPEAMLSLLACADARAAAKAACACARAALKHVAADEARPEAALAAAEAWIRGEGSLQDVRAATEQAADAARSAEDAAFDSDDEDEAADHPAAAASAAEGAANVVLVVARIERIRPLVSVRESAPGEALDEAISDLASGTEALVNALERLEARSAIADRVRSACACPSLEQLAALLPPQEPGVAIGAVLVGEQPDPFTVTPEWAAKYAPEGRLDSVWRAFPTASFHLLLLARLGDRRGLVRAACVCARTLLQYLPADEARPARALEAAERWAAGSATDAEVASALAALKAGERQRAAAFTVVAHVLELLQVEPGSALYSADQIGIEAAMAHAHRELELEDREFDEDWEEDLELDAKSERWARTLADLVSTTLPAPPLPPIAPRQR